MIKLYDRIKETTYTIGTGDILLSGPVLSFASFASAYNNNEAFFYTITDGTRYEIGSGSYISSNNSIKRFPVKSTNNDELVNFPEGLKEIFVNYPATNSIFNTSGTYQTPQNSGIAFWTSSNSISYTDKLVYDSGNIRIGINKSNPSYSIDIGGNGHASNVKASGFIVGSSGIYFASGNGDLSSYSGGRQLFHFEPLQITSPLSYVLETSGIVNQNLLLKKQNSNMIFSGPSGGCVPPCGPDYPTFRHLVKEDIPDLSSLYASYSQILLFSANLVVASGALNNKIISTSGYFENRINQLPSPITTNAVNNGRLSISSSDPTADGYSDTIYFVPYNGNRISLYDGINWQSVYFTSMVAKTVGTLYAPGAPVDPANTVFDIFAYLSAGSVLFESVPWANNTTRATPLVKKDGVYVKSGNYTRRYVGSVMPISYGGYPPAGGNKFQNTNNFRYIYNYYNKVPVLTYSNLRSPYSSRTWTCSSNIWRKIPNTYIGFLNSMTINVLCGIQEEIIDVNASVYYVSSMGSNVNYMLAVNSNRIDITKIDNLLAVFDEPTFYNIGDLFTDSVDNIGHQVRCSLMHKTPIGITEYYIAEKVPTGKNSPNLILNYTNGLYSTWRC